MQVASPVARSRLLKILAIGYMHPVPEFHRLATDGNYQDAVIRLAADLLDRAPRFGKLRISMQDFEASYITIFTFGDPDIQSLEMNSGGHRQLPQGQSRRELMLNLVHWYRHFGLRPRLDPEDNELPDHLACQLEFLAWLAHLEANAMTRVSTAIGYRNAQRDFTRRFTLPRLALLARSLPGYRAELTARSFFLELTTIARMALDQMLLDFDTKQPKSQVDYPGRRCVAAALARDE